MSASRSSGTSPLKSRISTSESASTFFALARHRPTVRIWSAMPPSPSAAIFSGVSAMAKSFFVALLTPASVACAESTTATSMVKAFV